MTSSVSELRRSLSQPFLEALDQLVEDPRGGWWRDVLRDPALFLAVRQNSLNIYHRGGSIFRVVLSEGRVVPETHVKYLVRQRQAYVKMSEDGRFSFGDEAALWSRYQGPKTLADMISCASALAGPEKTGLHALIIGNPKVIDLELALGSAAYAEEDGGSASGDDIGVLDNDADPNESKQGRRQDRLDAVTLEERDGGLWIAFHEAKHFANSELRARPGGTPPVGAQMQRYRQTLTNHAKALAASYGELCGARVRLHEMRSKAKPGVGAGPLGPLDPLIARAAQGERLNVDPNPRLIVFGFDRDQKEGLWKGHHDRLVNELKLRVFAIGNPQKGGAAAFAR